MLQIFYTVADSAYIVGKSAKKSWDTCLKNKIRQPEWDINL
jgi:hypothetical protein